MTNLQKRILTALIILPLSFFFLLKGGYFLIFFLILVFLAGSYEAFTVFKKKITILILNTILILSLFFIYFLRNDYNFPQILLFWVIILCISSDIGGYAFGKIFKWKKLTKISPKKTISGVFGSFFFSLIWLILVHLLSNIGGWSINFLSLKYVMLTIFFSAVAQVGDLTISYFKRLEKIKDTGKILPGHGGIFDRIDGLIFVIILTFVLNILKFIP